MSHQLCKNCQSITIREDGVMWCPLENREIESGEEAPRDYETGVTCWTRREYAKLTGEERRARLVAVGRKGGAKSKRRPDVARRKEDWVMMRLRRQDRDWISAYAKANRRTIYDVMHLLAEECRSRMPPPPAPAVVSIQA